MKNKISIIIIVLNCLFCGFMLYAEDNLIKNPSFEEAINGKPSYWVEAGWNMEAGVMVFSLDTGNPHSGKSSGKLENKLENHAYFTQLIAVEENVTYKFSAWIKTANVGKGNNGGAIGVMDHLEFAGDIRETSVDWKLAELYITTGKGFTSFTVLLSLGWYGSLNTGTVWFDDVSLVKTTIIPEGATVCILSNEPAQGEQQQQAESTVSQPQVPQNQAAMFFFFILGGIVILIGGSYLVLVVLKKKKKDVPLEEKKDEGTEANPKQDIGQDGENKQE